MRNEAEYYLPGFRDDIANAKHSILRPAFGPQPESEESTEPDINPIDWFSHALLVAMQGSGKTNLIRWRINQILPLIKEGKATLILLDPKDVLTRELPTLVRTIGLEDRTILIDPLEAPVSFNLFDRGNGSIAAIHATTQSLIRLLNTITLDLQPFQRDTLALAINALFATSDSPSFNDLFPILRKGKAALTVEKLPDDIRDIFENDFRESDSRYVVTRLNAFRRNPHFKPLVSGNISRFNLFDSMQSGKLILIRAGTAEPLYGKIWIEQIAKTIDARFNIPEEERTPTFVIIDEAQIFIGDSQNEHFADIIDRAREARIGMFIACQHMEQIKNVAVRTSLYNCAIKFISKTNGDIHNLARSLPGEIDANSFRRVPKYHFIFSSPESTETELVTFDVVQFPKWRWEDVHYFWRRHESNDDAPSETAHTFDEPPLPFEEPPAPPEPPSPAKPRKKPEPKAQDSDLAETDFEF